MSRTQLRAKSGVAPAVNEGETVGEIKGVPAVANPQTTTAGTGDTIWFCNPARTTFGANGEVCTGLTEQQLILPPQ